MNDLLAYGSSSSDSDAALVACNPTCSSTRDTAFNGGPDEEQVLSLEKLPAPDLHQQQAHGAAMQGPARDESLPNRKRTFEHVEGQWAMSVHLEGVPHCNVPRV
jgi:hypothetical protein